MPDVLAFEELERLHQGDILGIFIELEDVVDPVISLRWGILHDEDVFYVIPELNAGEGFGPWFDPGNLEGVVHQVGTAVLALHVVPVDVEDAFLDEPLRPDAEVAPDDGAVQAGRLEVVVGDGVDQEGDDFRRASAVCAAVDEPLNPWFELLDDRLVDAEC